MSLDTLTSVYKAVTRPLPVLGVPPLDIIGAVRLSVALRQIRGILSGSSGSKTRPGIDNELVRNIWTNWTVVWGGETILCALLAQTPSFLLSPVYPLLFLLGEVFAYCCPVPPAPSLPAELPLSIVDAFTRVGLLTTLAFIPILSHPVPEVAQSPLALIIASTLLANGGFFLVTSASMLSPQGWKPSTPTELRPYGWTAVDLWSAGLVTSIFAIMTRSQPWWGWVYDVLFNTYCAIAPGVWQVEEAPIFDTDKARSICLLLLIIQFSARAMWNHSSPYIKTLGRA
ncbi:hypothetical protein DACRYDRAFT_23921 [Dacryopinax primogenitus]|uniref:Uncharacterized protein n=1 Tax=Dacryopinax primogenitus (strain DJM 731) TaxID=1858805 RepID=M5FTG8_DACPD|nr:uncharacterized protein DACRYDRAFT_23921 [Dacryopinax primogenitus]EJT99368.1 hypothetical protein DACRYDRAFT_23921 [Dacryopinax primogenitus]